MPRILIIDDDRDVLGMLKKMLERAAYEVTIATDGAEGLACFAEAPADLVITDLLMPGKEGLETIRDLKRDFPELKIIAISGGGRNAPEGYLKVAKAMGAARSFAKPFGQTELLEAIEELLGD